MVEVLLAVFCLSPFEAELMAELLLEVREAQLKQDLSSFEDWIGLAHQMRWSALKRILLERNTRTSFDVESLAVTSSDLLPSVRILESTLRATVFM